MLNPIAPQIHAIEGDLFAGIMHFPLRMLVVETPDGLVLWSPIKLEAAQMDAIDALGTVAWIIAPNCFHHLYLSDAMQRWPDAQVAVPEGLDAKRKDLDLSGAVPLEPLPAGLAKAFDSVRIEGAPKMNESVLLHRATGSLIVCDLVFNVHATKRWTAPLVYRMVGAWKRTAQSRLWRFFTKDRAAAAASVRQVIALDFDRLIPAHGEVIEHGGKAALAAGTSWMQAGGQPALNAPT
jgi:hypothetical protein